MKKRLTVGILVAVVVLIIVVGVPLTPQKNLGPVGLTLAADQVGSPIQVLSTTSTPAGAFTRVTFRNRGEAQLTSVVFGAFIHTVGVATGKTRMVRGRTILTAVPPGGTTDVTVALLNDRDLRVIRRQNDQGAVAELGVMAVGFADGTRWTFDLSRSRFGAGTAPFNVSRKSCGSASGLRNVAFADDGGGHYECETSENFEWCENQNGGQKCTNHVCTGTIQECPYQKCKYIKIE